MHMNAYTYKASCRPGGSSKTEKWPDIHIRHLLYVMHQLPSGSCTTSGNG